jgi:hypothetical protein
LKNVISFFSGNECLFEKHAVDFLNLPFFNGSSNFTKNKTFQTKMKKARFSLAVHALERVFFTFVFFEVVSKLSEVILSKKRHQTPFLLSLF